MAQKKIKLPVILYSGIAPMNSGPQKKKGGGFVNDNPSAFIMLASDPRIDQYMEAMGDIDEQYKLRAIQYMAKHFVHKNSGGTGLGDLFGWSMPIVSLEGGEKIAPVYRSRYDSSSFLAPHIVGLGLMTKSAFKGAIGSSDLASGGLMEMYMDGDGHVVVKPDISEYIKEIEGRDIKPVLDSIDEVTDPILRKACLDLYMCVIRHVVIAFQYRGEKFGSKVKSVTLKMPDPVKGFTFGVMCEMRAHAYRHTNYKDGSADYETEVTEVKVDLSGHGKMVIYDSMAKDLAMPFVFTSDEEMDELIVHKEQDLGAEYPSGRTDNLGNIARIAIDINSKKTRFQINQVHSVDRAEVTPPVKFNGKHGEMKLFYGMSMKATRAVKGRLSASALPLVCNDSVGKVTIESVVSRGTKVVGESYLVCDTKPFNIVASAMLMQGVCDDVTIKRPTLFFSEKVGGDGNGSINSVGLNPYIKFSFDAPVSIPIDGIGAEDVAYGRVNPNGVAYLDILSFIEGDLYGATGRGLSYMNVDFSGVTKLLLVPYRLDEKSVVRVVAPESVGEWLTMCANTANLLASVDTGDIKVIHKSYANLQEKLLKRTELLNRGNG